MHFGNYAVFQNKFQITLDFMCIWCYNDITKKNFNLWRIKQ